MVYQSGDYRWARSLLQEAARKLPDQPDLLYDLAWACYGVGQVAEAQTAMRAAVESGKPLSKLEDAKRFLALVSAAQTPAEAQAAAALAAQTLAAQSNYIPALMITALVDDQAGNRQEAKQVYERILAANSLFAPASKNLAVLRAKEAKTDSRGLDLAARTNQTAFELSETNASLDVLGVGPFRPSDPMTAPSLESLLPNKGLPGTNSVP